MRSGKSLTAKAVADLWKVPLLRLDVGALVQEVTGVDEGLRHTIALAESARKLGALAASAFGAGFGGSVWALVRRSEADDFLDAWRQHYTECFPERADDAELFHSRPSSCAHEID